MKLAGNLSMYIFVFFLYAGTHVFQFASFFFLTYISFICFQFQNKEETAENWIVQYGAIRRMVNCNERYNN